jgi:hypothetical protein
MRFTYHRESRLRLLLPILPLVGIGDILFVELVVLPHAPTWLGVVVHALAICGVLWLIGLYATLRARPHQLVGGRLTLHRGILGRIDIPVAQIASIDELPSFADGWKKRTYCKGALRMDVAGPTVLELRLHTSGTRVLVSVDEPASFIAAAARLMQSS